MNKRTRTCILCGRQLPHSLPFPPGLPEVYDSPFCDLCIEKIGAQHEFRGITPNSGKQQKTGQESEERQYEPGGVNHGPMYLTFFIAFVIASVIASVIAYFTGGNPRDYIEVGFLIVIGVFLLLLLAVTGRRP